MKILNLLASGGIGGIEVLCKDIGTYSEDKHTFIFLFDKGVIFDEMKSQGLDVIDLSMLRIMPRMRKLLSISYQYDIIVLHHGSMGMNFFYDFLMFFNHKSRFVLMEHDCFGKSTYYTYNSKWKNFLRKCLLENSMKYSDRIVYVSEAGRNSFFNAFKIKAEKTEVVYNGISEKLISQGGKNIPVFEGKLNILFIGRLAEIKGVHLLIKAASKLKDKIPLEIKILGDGPERKKLSQLAIDEHVDDFVTLVGAVREKQEYYEWANVFVYPSVWQEVFGISIVEALSYGLPCIANNVGGIPEIINGKNGVLTMESDTEGIVKAIEKIYNYYCQGLLEDMSFSAKKTAKKFSIINTVNQMHNIYGELVE